MEKKTNNQERIKTALFEAAGPDRMNGRWVDEKRKRRQLDDNQSDGLLYLSLEPTLLLLEILQDNLRRRCTRFKPFFLFVLVLSVFF